MKDEDVAKYLLENPEFAETHADLLSSIYVPHPHDGRAIPIGERQLIILREKNRLIEKKLRELIKFGEENDAIGEKMHRLAMEMFAAKSLEELVFRVRESLRDAFLVPHLALRIWGVRPEHTTFVEFSEASPAEREIADSLLTPYCGPHIADELKSWFGESAAHLRSFALIPLRNEKTIGLLALGSEDSQRFFADIGTLHLTRLGEWLSAAFSRHA